MDFITNKELIVQKISENIQLVLDKEFEELIKNIVVVDNKNSSKLNPNNPENIETGISGIVLFLIEAYRYDKQNYYLIKIEKLVQSLLSYCKNNPTNNYSLYTGRAGFVFLLLSYYEISKNEELLIESINVMNGSDSEYLNSPYTSDYLYNGRSGTLLVLIKLYDLTKSNLISKLIRKFTLRILNNAVVSKYGISWKAKEELNIHNSSGFALGASGIKYTLDIVNLFFPSEILNYYSILSGNYIDSTWNNSEQNWINYEKDIFDQDTLIFYKMKFLDDPNLIVKPKYELGWASGKVGQLIAKKSSDLHLNIEQFTFQRISNNIYEGLSGVGIYLLNNINCEIDKMYLNKIISIILFSQKNNSLTGGLLFGELGSAYFLIQTLNFSNNYGILQPLKFDVDKSFSNKKDLKLDYVMLKKHLLMADYKQTIFLLEKINPFLLHKYLSQNESKNISSELLKFQAFIYNNIDVSINEKLKIALFKIYLIEKDLFEVKSHKNNLQIHLKGLFYNELVIALFNNSDEWILNQIIGISMDVKIVNLCYKINDNIDFNIFNNFSFEYIIFELQEDEQLEYVPDFDSFILHCFDNPKTINVAYEEFIDKCILLPTSTVDKFVKFTESYDINDFYSRVKYLFIEKVKYFIFDAILYFLNSNNKLLFERL